MEIETSLGKLASTLTFTVMSWRIFQIRKFSWKLPRPLKTLWRATCGPQAAICSPLLQKN